MYVKKIQHYLLKICVPHNTGASLNSSCLSISGASGISPSPSHLPTAGSWSARPKSGDLWGGEGCVRTCVGGESSFLHFYLLFTSTVLPCPTLSLTWHEHNPGSKTIPASRSFEVQEYCKSFVFPSCTLPVLEVLRGDRKEVAKRLCDCERPKKIKDTKNLQKIPSECWVELPHASKVVEIDNWICKEAEGRFELPRTQDWVTQGKPIQNTRSVPHSRQAGNEAQAD